MIGESVPEDLEVDLQSELAAVEALRTAITHCAQVEDYTTRSMFEEMIRSEDRAIAF